MIPQNAIADIEIIDEQPSLTYGLDLEKGIIIGQIDELSAVKQAVYLALNTERFSHVIYSWGYGVEFDDLIGAQPTFAYPEIERRIKEALLVDDRITGVADFSFTRDRGSVTASFTVTTTYGNFNTERTVSI